MTTAVAESGIGVLRVAGSNSASKMASDGNREISGVLASEGTEGVVRLLKKWELNPFNKRASRGWGQGAKSRLR